MCKNLSGVCTANTECWTLHCLRAAGGLGFTLRTNGYSQHFPSCKSKGMCRALPTCAHGVAGQCTKGNGFSCLRDGASFVGLGLLVTSACRSGLNNRGGVSRVHAAGGTTSQNCTHTLKNQGKSARTNMQIQKQIRRRAHEHGKTHKDRETKHTNHNTHKNVRNPDLFDTSIHFFSFLIISVITLLFLLPDTFNSMMSSTNALRTSAEDLDTLAENEPPTGYEPNDHFITDPGVLGRAAVP